MVIESCEEDCPNVAVIQKGWLLCKDRSRVPDCVHSALQTTSETSTRRSLYIIPVSRILTCPPFSYFPDSSSARHVEWGDLLCHEMNWLHSRTAHPNATTDSQCRLASVLLREEPAPSLLIDRSKVRFPIANLRTQLPCP